MKRAKTNRPHEAVIGAVVAEAHRLRDLSRPELAANYDRLFSRRSALLWVLDQMRDAYGNHVVKRIQSAFEEGVKRG